ncbi:hypothetical protein BGZ67_007901 [Mortierella alpina]|nr:hypothetical protein BGZ67_007901 [Mortierella alpina]
MKFATALVLIVSCIAVATAHGGLLYPPPRGGIDTKQYNGRFHAFIGFKDKKQSLKFPCGGYAPGKITPMKAGETVNVRFYASDMDAAQIRKQPKFKGSNKFKQARHGGGMCEFSLSYDNGKSFHLIGRYTKTCPDSYYSWPVKIPDNIEKCDQAGCLFVWSWTANILPQYYMNCADIRLEGTTKGKRPNKGSIQVVDFNGKFNGEVIRKGVKSKGDGIKHGAGKGPDKRQIDSNLKGIYPDRE